MQTRKGKNQALMSDVKSENQKSREEARKDKERTKEECKTEDKSLNLEEHRDTETRNRHRSTRAQDGHGTDKSKNNTGLSTNWTSEGMRCRWRDTGNRTVLMRLMEDRCGDEHRNTRGKQNTRNTGEYKTNKEINKPKNPNHDIQCSS